MKGLYTFMFLLCSNRKNGKQEGKEGLGKTTLVFIAQVIGLGLAVRRTKDEPSLGTDEG